MSGDQDGCEWLNVSSGTGPPGRLDNNDRLTAFDPGQPG